MKDVIYRIKTAFNTDLDAVHRQKVQELNRLKDRNTNIRDITLELDLKDTLWEPSLTSSERPEGLLTVNDSEVTVLSGKQLNSSQKVQETKSTRAALWFGCFSTEM